MDPKQLPVWVPCPASGAAPAPWEKGGKVAAWKPPGDALGTQPAGTRKPRGALCVPRRWPRAGARLALSHRCDPAGAPGRMLVQEWVTAAAATSCGAQPPLGNSVLPSCGGGTCPTSMGKQTAWRSWCGEVALSFREAGHGLQGSCSRSPSGWVVLGWAAVSLPQQSCLRAVGP